MNSIRVQLLKYYSEAVETFGFITKENRQLIGLEKTHYNDAIVIATGCLNKPKFLVDIVYKKRCIAKGQYRLHQGQRSEMELPRGKVKGFLNKDIVKYRGCNYLIKALMSRGYCVLMNIDGVEQRFENPKTIKLDSLERISARSTTRCISQKII